MNEDLTKQKKANTSEEYRKFLEAVEKNGAYVRILVTDDQGKKSIKNFNIKKGSKNHTIKDEDLIGFRPLTRREQRSLFHTPYKFGRRLKD